MEKFKRLSVFIECSTNNTPTVKTIKRYIDFISQMGYNELYLGCTDGYKIEGEPYFNYKRGGYTTEDFQEMDAYAQAHGITLIASIQTLAHLHYLKRYEAYEDMFDTDNVLMVGDERVYALIEKMLGAISKGLKVRRIHLGMDEAFGLARGEYLKKNGFRPVSDVFLEHLKRVAAIAEEKFGYECEIWSDILLDKNENGFSFEKVRESLPKNVDLIKWGYRINSEENLKKGICEQLSVSKKLSYAGACWKICGFAPSNTYSLAALIPQMKVSAELGLKQFVITMWSDGGGMCNDYSVLPVLFTAAEYANGVIDNVSETNKDRFKQITGADYDALFSLEYLNDPFKKKLTTLNSRSYWILFSDILIGNYDTLLSGKTDEMYGKLAKEYSKQIDGEFGHLFEMASTLARILSVKSFLGIKMRKAYKIGDKKALRELIENDLQMLSAEMKKFIEIFERYWLNDCSTFGLDSMQVFLGDQVCRYRYIYKRINDYIENGTPIEECEGISLPPFTNPDVNEDNCFDMNYKKMISYCCI